MDEKEGFFQEMLPKDEFFQKVEKLGLALTFDDVRLKTGHSTVMPDKVLLNTKFSRNVPLKIPIVSADMDTVTEHELAIELAKLGGIGVIHKNLTPEQQAYEVARVKYYLNGLIEKPICVYDDETINSILQKIKEKRYPFNSFPVLNRNDVLVGILTRTDFDFCDNQLLTARDIMTKNVITARQGTLLDEAYNIMKREKKKILPLVNSGGRVVGLYTFKDLKAIKSGISSNYNIDEKGQLRVGAAIGVGSEALERVTKLVAENVDVVVISTAHADTESVIETLKEIKRRYRNLDVVVGNISEPESARRLAEAGADGLKIGQGPGSICTTRIIAGIGCPQISAVYKCSKIGDEYGIPVCADGGLRYSGDVTIAIGVGASSVMMGNMLAGTKEAPGDLIFRKGRQWKRYRGMGSISAMEAHKGSRERYLQADTGKGGLISEGVEGLVPYKGELKDVIFQYIGGLRRGMGYVGAGTIDKLRKKANFIRISHAGHTESHPHDIDITSEPPNYSISE